MEASLIPLFREDITSKLIAHSECAETGKRISTHQTRYPRIIHAELMTHRALSRNASSSRAIPVTSILTRDAEMFVPNFRANKPGMSPGDWLTPEKQAEAEAVWREAAEACIKAARTLSNKDGLNVHKQWANRLVEWFGYIDVLISATEWRNFDALRDHGAAQDEIRLLARAIIPSRRQFGPTLLLPGQWHLPYITEKDRYEAGRGIFNYASRIREVLDTVDDCPDLSLNDALLLIASAARACRLSYSKLDGTPSTFDDDIERWRKLVPSNDPVHASPLEHQATPLGNLAPKYQANFRGWGQFRQFVIGHDVPG